MTDKELFGNSEQLDLISRRGTIVALKSGLFDEDGVHVWRDVRNTTINAAIEVVEAMPSAQQERKRGKWIYNSPVTMKCNQCGFVIKDWDWHRFKCCPNCGANMKGEQDD